MIDWDGTVTVADTLAAVLRAFVDASVLVPLTTRLDSELSAGRVSLREVTSAEFAMLTANLATVVAFVTAHAQVRAGFAEFVRRYDPIIVSTSFHETIGPVLARALDLARDDGCGRPAIPHVMTAAVGWGVCIDRPIE